MVAKRVWMLSRKPARPTKIDELEKRGIIHACETFIDKVLEPRFLPEIKPSDRFNYPIDTRGDWRAGRYRFMQRYRVGGGLNDGQEFDASFARIDRMGRDRFAIH
jgi:hypothetical protein